MEAQKEFVPCVEIVSRRENGNFENSETGLFQKFATILNIYQNSMVVQRPCPPLPEAPPLS